MKRTKWKTLLFAGALSLCLSNVPNSKAFAAEADDTMRGATPISFNVQESGILIDGNDKDYYKVVLPKNGKLSVYMENDGESKKVQILRNDGTVFTELNTDSDKLGQATANVGLAKGTYYIYVGDYSGYDVPYKLKATFTPSETIEKEKNETLREANSIPLNTKISGQLQYGNDKDYFKFTLPKAGNVTLSMNNAGEYSKKGYLLMSNNYAVTQVGTNPDFPGSVSNQVGLPAGTYYVKIADYDGYFVPYDFTVKYVQSDFYEKELNDSFSKANPVGVNTKYYGTLQGGSDDDYYSLKLTKKDTVTVSMPNSGSDNDFYLKNSKGTILKQHRTDSSIKGERSVKATLNPGTYYIHIGNYDGYDQRYSFSVRSSIQALSTKQVSIKNYKGKSDLVTVSGAKSGDLVKIYDKSNKLLSSKKADKSGKAVFSFKQLGSKGGYIYVSLTKPNRLESAKTKVSFNKE